MMMLSTSLPLVFLTLPLREGCTNENPEKVWSCDDNMWGLVMKAVPKLEESESGQMVLK